MIARERSAKVAFASTCDAGGFSTTTRGDDGASANSRSTYGFGVSSSLRAKRWR